MTTRSTLILKAAAEKIEKGGWSEDGLVPPTRWLAQEWETSLVMVRKVLADLCARKMLVRNGRNGRYFLAGKVPFAAQKVPNQPRFLQSRAAYIAKKLRDRILNGRVERKCISIREMVNEFSCSFQTASAVLAQLVAQGLIKREANRCIIDIVASKRKSNSTVYIILAEHEIGDSLTTAFLREIETSLVRIGWSFPKLLTYSGGERVNLPPDHLLAGLIVGRVSHEFLEIIGRKNVPTVFLDRNQAWTTENSPPGKSFLLRPDENHAGQVMIRYLLQQGHRTIAVFSPYGNDQLPWLQIRLNGMRTAFEAMKLESAGSMQLFFKKVDLEFPGRKFRTFFHQAIGSAIKTPDWRSMVLQRFTKQYLYRNAEHVRDLAQHFMVMAPLFAEALEKSGATAWVCVNDSTALAALQFLESRHVDIPGRLSLVGFDNSPAASMLSLTSYDFGYDRLGAIAVNCLCKPSLMRREYGNRIMSRGMIIQRHSSEPSETNAIQSQ